MPDRDDAMGKVRDQALLVRDGIAFRKSAAKSGFVPMA